jgi:hypothetical protein
VSYVVKSINKEASVNGWILGKHAECQLAVHDGILAILDGLSFIVKLDGILLSVVGISPLSAVIWLISGKD